MLSSIAGRRPQAALTLAAFLALAACSGGGSQTALPASPPAGAPAAMRATSQAAGASFAYRGTLQQSGSNGKATFTVTQNVTTSQTTFGGRPVTDYHGVETATGKGSSLKTTSDAYVATVASTIRTGSDVELVKRESSDSTGITQTTIYGAGNGVYDQLPEVPQARWSNTAARTVSIANSVAGSSIDDVYHADGSYDEHAVPVEGRTASSQSYPDGYATYQFPYQGSPNNSTIAFSPPAGGKLQILFTNYLLHLTQLYTMNEWYPASPPPLASDAYQNAGTVAIPSACNVPKHYGKLQRKSWSRSCAAGYRLRRVRDDAAHGVRRAVRARLHDRARRGGNVLRLRRGRVARNAAHDNCDR